MLSFFFSKRIIVKRNVIKFRQLLPVVPVVAMASPGHSQFQKSAFTLFSSSRIISIRKFHSSSPSLQQNGLSKEDLQMEDVTKKIIAHPAVFDKYLTLKIKLFEHGFLVKKDRSLGSLFSIDSIKKAFDSIKYLMSGDLKNDIADFYYVLREAKLVKEDDDLKIIATTLYRDDIDELVKQLKSKEFDDVRKQEAQEDTKS